MFPGDTSPRPSAARHRSPDSPGTRSRPRSRGRSVRHILKPSSSVCWVTREKLYDQSWIKHLANQLDDAGPGGILLLLLQRSPQAGGQSVLLPAPRPAVGLSQARGCGGGRDKRGLVKQGAVYRRRINENIRASSKALKINSKTQNLLS